MVSKDFFSLQYFSTILLLICITEKRIVIKFIIQEELQIFRQKVLGEQNKEEDN